MTGGVLKSGKGSGPLPCAASPSSHDHCEGDCSHMAGTYFGDEYPRCPMAMLADDGAMQAVYSVRRDASLSPLAGWPDTYTAWVPRLWARIEREIDQRDKDS